MDMVIVRIGPKHRLGCCLGSARGLCQMHSSWAPFFRLPSAVSYTWPKRKGNADRGRL